MAEQKDLEAFYIVMDNYHEVCIHEKRHPTVLSAWNCVKRTSLKEKRPQSDFKILEKITRYVNLDAWALPGRKK